VKRLESAHPLLASFVPNQQMKITGGVYDLANGKIALLVPRVIAFDGAL
jgi:carbonic anhydrase